MGRTSVDRLVTPAALALVSGIPFAAPAAAQDLVAGKASPPACRAYATASASDKAQELLASCHGRGVVLGSITAFSASYSEALQALLIEANFGPERRVYLISPGADGRPQVEDLSGEIALAAGRGPMSGLGDVEIDATAFALTGAIGVRGQTADNRSSRQASINLGAQLITERSRAATAAPPGEK